MSKFMIVLFSISLGLILSASSPLFMCLLVVSLAISSSGLISLFTTKWLSLALLLIFLGGMMVIFLYTSALSTSKKFYLPPVQASTLICFIAPLPLLVAPLPGMAAPQASLFSLFLSLPFVQMLFLLTYLLISLIMVVKFVESFKGALKAYT